MNANMTVAEIVATQLENGSVSLADAVEADMKPLANQAVLIVGDLILDHYLWGSVERTTPEAPVPIVLHERDSWILGAAGNVAHNIKTLGGKAYLVGIAGKDSAGKQMQTLLRETGISTAGIVTAANRPTTVKTRVVSSGQQLLRIDHEETDSLDPQTIEKLIATIRRLAGKCKAVLLSDYAKGVLGPKVIAAAVGAAHQYRIPVLVDPKGHDYSRYKGADILTPNLRELSLAAGYPIDDEKDMQKAGRNLIKKCGLKALALTMDAEGMAVLRPRHAPFRLPARAPEVSDVTGAGDTTIATLALAIASGMGIEDAATLANHAGGIVVGKLGVSTVSPQELKMALSGTTTRSKLRTIDDLKILLSNQQTKGRKVVFTNGCFDLLHPGHIHFLHAARRLGDILVVGMNTDRSVRAIKGLRRPILAQDERAAILSALEVVDYIVFFNDLTPEPLLEALRPDVLVKGANTPEDQIVGREIVEGYGGTVRLQTIPHSSSVTDLIASIVDKFEGEEKA